MKCFGFCLLFVATSLVFAACGTREVPPSQLTDSRGGARPRFDTGAQNFANGGDEPDALGDSDENESSARDSANPNHSNPESGILDAPVPPRRPPNNTNYCQVTEAGEIRSSEAIHTERRGGCVYGRGGGCVNRPIREVWAALLNHPSMRARDVTEYRTHLLLDQIDHSQGIYLVFNIESIVRGLMTITWNTRWIYSVLRGTLQRPRQVAIDGQNTTQNIAVTYTRDGYILDRVNPNVTSFAMDQEIQAWFVNEDRVRRNITDILGKARQNPPDWTHLE